MKKLEIKLKHFEELEAIVDQERMAVSFVAMPTCYHAYYIVGDAKATVAK